MYAIRSYYEMIEIIKAIIFGIVEGITEWLPISSTVITSYSIHYTKLYDGILVEALENARLKIKDVMSKISNQSVDVSVTSQELYATIEELNSTFDTIHTSTTRIVTHIEDVNS